MFLEPIATLMTTKINAEPMVKANQSTNNDLNDCLNRGNDILKIVLKKTFHL